MRHCSAYLYRPAHWAPRARYTCLYTCTADAGNVCPQLHPSACLSRQCSRVQHRPHYSYFCHEYGTACSACNSCRRYLDAYFIRVWLGAHASVAARDRTGTGRMEPAHAIHTAMQPHSCEAARKICPEMSDNGTDITDTGCCATLI